MTRRQNYNHRVGVGAKNKKPYKINSYRSLKTVTVIKMGTFVKKNKLNNSSEWFTFGQKLDHNLSVMVFFI